jgi:hypothetical protein
VKFTIETIKFLIFSPVNITHAEDLKFQIRLPLSTCWGIGVRAVKESWVQVASIFKFNNG